MTDYLYFAIRLLACALDMGFLYIWLRHFSKLRRCNRVLTGIVLFASAAMLCYVNYIEKGILSTALGLLCFAFISLLLFEDRIKRLLLYTVINYVIGMAVGLMFDAVPGMMAERAVKVFVYYLIMKVLSTRAADCKSGDVSLCMEERYGLWHYIAFYSVPIVSCALLTGIYILNDAAVIEVGLWSYGLMAVTAIGIIMINVTLIYFFEELAMMMAKSRKIELEDKCSELERKYYADLNTMHERYDTYLHDIRHTMRTIATLAEEGNCEEIGAVIEGMRIALGSIDEQLVCSHKILNALLTERRGYAKDNGVVVKFEISEPLYFQDISEPDLVVLMGNLLDNAIEAGIRSGKKENIVCQISAAANGRHMIIQVENAYEEKEGSGAKLTQRHWRIGEKHGIGLASIQEVVRKYGGIFESNKGGGKYIVKVILPIQMSA